MRARRVRAEARSGTVDCSCRDGPGDGRAPTVDRIHGATNRCCSIVLTTNAWSLLRGASLRTNVGSRCRGTGRRSGARRRAAWISGADRGGSDLLMSGERGRRSGLCGALEQRATLVGGHGRAARRGRVARVLLLEDPRSDGDLRCADDLHRRAWRRARRTRDGEHPRRGDCDQQRQRGAPPPTECLQHGQGWSVYEEDFIFGAGADRGRELCCPFRPNTCP